MSEQDALRKDPVLRLTVAAVLMAMNIVLSMSVFSVPVPGGHLYFCDVIIVVAALLLDPLAAFAVGGLGSFIGDMLFYPAPMFVSLATHGLQAAAVSALARKWNKFPSIGASAAAAVGAVIMVIGYTLGRAYVYATPEYAALKLPFEIMQAALGAVLGVALCYPLGLKRRLEQLLRRMQ